MHYNCLIVDDEKMLAENTCEYFNLFDVKSAYVLNPNDCIRFINEHTVDVIMLDINLDDASGYDLCKKLRKSIQTPIIFISARSSDDDVIAALNIGGDDYVKKPYSLSVLLAKINAVLKRYSGSQINKKECYENKGLRVNFVTEKVSVYDKDVTLKGMEYKLLIYLINNPGRVIHKEELFESVWEDKVTGDGTLNVHIRHLREKIEDNPNEPLRIKTIWGRGYIYEER